MFTRGNPHGATCMRVMEGRGWNGMAWLGNGAGCLIKCHHHIPELDGGFSCGMRASHVGADVP